MCWLTEENIVSWRKEIYSGLRLLQKVFKCFWERKHRKVFGIKVHIFPSQFSAENFIRNCRYTFSFMSPQLLSKRLFYITFFNYRVIMTLMIQNKSVVIWLEMFQHHLRAAGLAVVCSKISTESLAARLSKNSLPEVTQSGTLEEKPNYTKIVIFVLFLKINLLTSFES